MKNVVYFYLKIAKSVLVTVAARTAEKISRSVRCAQFITEAIIFRDVVALFAFFHQPRPS